MSGGEGGKEKKKDVLKAMNLFMDVSLKLASRDLTLFFQHVFVYIKVSVCACVFILLALLCH